MRAALIYQRATSEADRRIADRISDLVDEQRGPGDRSEDDGDGDGGATGVLVPPAVPRVWPESQRDQLKARSW